MAVSSVPECNTRFTVLATPHRTPVYHTIVLSIFTHLCCMPRIWLLSLIMTFTWTVLKGIHRRNGRWKNLWNSGSSVRRCMIICWAKNPFTTCTLVMNRCEWRLCRIRSRRGRGEGLQQIEMKRVQSINSTWAVLPMSCKKWVGCVVIWRSHRSIFIWSHHKIIWTHVRYVALTATQPVTFARGNQFTSFLRKGVIKERPDLLSITVIIFLPSLWVYQVEWGK